MTAELRDLLFWGGRGARVHGGSQGTKFAHGLHPVLSMPRIKPCLGVAARQEHPLSFHA